MTDVTGFIDPHIHAAPDVVPRLLDDIAVVRAARAAGLAGVLFKSHATLTADRATLAARQVPGIRVWGGLVLNRAIGGFNPAAVETALAFGAAEIWMPTADAANDRQAHGQTGGLTPAGDSGALLPAVHEILALIAARDVILGTGHLSAAETAALVPVARAQGVRKILITHPEAPFIDMPLSLQCALAAQGCRFERTWVFTTPALGQVLTPARLVADIRAVGAESTVLATDLGQVGNPSPVVGLRAFAQTCLDAGLPPAVVRQMGTQIGDWLR